MKKYLSLMLAILMVLTALFTMVACQDSEGPNEDEKKPPVVGPGTEGGNSTERIPLDYLPSDTYDAASFHILAWSANGVTDVGYRWIPWEEGDVLEKDGDMLGSAVFDRNAWVEETYDVVISQEYVSVDPVNGAPDYATVVRNDAGSGESAYQLFTLRSCNIVNLVEEELFADMNDYSAYIHTDAPWWVADSVRSFTLGSHLYVASSEMLLRDKGATAALFFNQTVAADYTALPNFFELAENREWTFEEMIDACTIVSGSLDGDEQMNSAQDMWGCVGGDDPVYYLFNAAGYKFAEINDEGYIDYKYGYNEDTILTMKSIFDDFMYKDFYLNEGVNGKAFLENDQDIFVEGQALFKSGMVKDTTNVLKNMKQMYGILPHPLYSLDQEEYSSLVWEHHDSVLGIPAHVGNKEMCAVVLEALSWQSYYSVHPVFYDTILLNRAAKDAESKEMLQIIFATRSYDPGLYWDPSALHGQEGLLRLSQKGTSDIAGMWAGFRDTVEKNMAEVNAWVDAHE
jgi:hypothetical protein